jgi:hypothetical protein
LRATPLEGRTAAGYLRSSTAVLRQDGAEGLVGASRTLQEASLKNG